jgi:PIN domain nuclease of toxin-antitoxin system
MRLPLDTHVFIWWILNSKRLSVVVRELIADPDNSLCLSAASTWELVIKARLGKLVLPDAPEKFIAAQLAANRIDPLPVTVAHTLQLVALPDIHRDPFDRMLVAQAVYDGVPLVTDDPFIR